MLIYSLSFSAPLGQNVTYLQNYANNFTIGLVCTPLLLIINHANILKDIDYMCRTPRYHPFEHVTKMMLVFSSANSATSAVLDDDISLCKVLMNYQSN